MAKGKLFGALEATVITGKYYHVLSRFCPQVSSSNF